MYCTCTFHTNPWYSSCILLNSAVLKIYSHIDGTLILVLLSHTISLNWFYRAVLRIQDVYLGSRIRIFPSRDPGSKRFRNPVSRSASKNLSIFNPTNCFQALGNMIRDVHPGTGSRVRIFIIPDPGVKKRRIPDLYPQHWTLVHIIWFC
jgi:hypothetical protein